MPYSLHGLIWLVLLIAFLAGSVVTAGDEEPARWFLFVFGASLVAQAVFINVESRGRSLRWFAAGVLSAAVASSYAAMVRGPLAFVHLAVGSQTGNALTPALDTLPGCLLIAAGLAMLCGTAVAAVQLLFVQRSHLALVSLVLLLSWLLFWHVGVAAYAFPWPR